MLPTCHSHKSGNPEKQSRNLDSCFRRNDDFLLLSAIVLTLDFLGVFSLNFEIPDSWGIGKHIVSEAKLLLKNERVI